MSWSIALQQTAKGDVLVKTVYRPLISESNPDEIERFIPVCEQMILENGNERHTIKYFAGKTKQILIKDQHTNTTYNDKPLWQDGKYYPRGTIVISRETTEPEYRTVSTGGFIYDYGQQEEYNRRPTTQNGRYYPKGTLLVKKQDVKESRMSPQSFAHFLIEKFGEDLAGEIITAFVEK